MNRKTLSTGLRALAVATALAAVPVLVTAQTAPTMTLTQKVPIATVQQAFSYPPIPSSNPKAQFQITVPVKLAGLPIDAAAFRVSCEVGLGGPPRSESEESGIRRATGFGYGTIPTAAAGALRSVYTEITVPVEFAIPATNPNTLLQALSGPAYYRCMSTITRSSTSAATPTDAYYTYGLNSDILFQGGVPSQFVTQSAFMLDSHVPVVGYLSGQIP